MVRQRAFRIPILIFVALNFAPIPASAITDNPNGIDNIDAGAPRPISGPTIAYKHPADIGDTSSSAGADIQARTENASSHTWTNQNVVTLVAAILAFAASMFAAGASVYNSRFGRFAGERWWDLKVKAYSRIIEALSALVYYYEEQYDAEINCRNLTDSHKKEIAEHWRKGYAEIKRVTAIGAFLISPEAESALQKMRNEKDNGIHLNDWFGQLDADYAATRDCLRAIVDAAKKDIHNTWWVAITNRLKAKIKKQIPEGGI